ncbi:hypothetical protein L0244_26730 [bacterium]|nr:hypothetical protein [bacterium]
MQATDVSKEPSQPAAQQHAVDEIVYQIMKIGQLSKLPNNWDSYGGKAIPFEVCEKAAKYLYGTFQELSNELELFEMPFIAPAGDGSIVFEWKSDKAELIVVFRSNTQLDVEYLTVEKAGDKENEKEGLFNSKTAFVQAMKWFAINRVWGN